MQVVGYYQLKMRDDKIIVRSNGVATYVAKDIPYAAWETRCIR